MLFITLAAFSSGLVWGQQSATNSSGQEEQSLKIAEGALTKVDLDGKTLTVKTEQGEEMQFTFNDQTEVQGAENSIEGLSPSESPHITVHYEDGWTSDTAKRIEVGSASESARYGERIRSQSGSEQRMSQSERNAMESSSAALSESQARQESTASAQSQERSFTRNQGQANEEASPQARQTGSESATLPQTASPLPLIGLLGFGSLGTAWLVEKIRR